MSTNLRRLGVYGENLPTKKSKTVAPSDFQIGGILGFFERKYDHVFSVKNPKDFAEIFGKQISSGWYGNDVVKGFFDNVAGVDATLYAQAHVGWTGSAIDAVQASQIVNNTDGGGALLLTIKAAYQTYAEYGVSGNRTGITITNGTRWSTTCMTTGAANTDTWIYCNSVSDLNIGDTLKIFLTDSGAATVYKIINGIDASTNKVSFTGSIHASKKATAGDIIQVMGIRLRLWRKDLSGVVNEVEPELGAIYCSISSLVNNYYICNVFANSKWVTVTRAATSPATPDVDFPADVATATYPTNGADGTAPTTAAHWAHALTNFDNLPIRFLTNAETTDNAIQDAGEAYCYARQDSPIWLYGVAKSQTLAQLQQIGYNFQLGREVDGVVVAQWLGVTDPFVTSLIAPDRQIPNMGHVMGAWIRSIGTKGVHYIPATKDINLFGINSVIGDQIVNDVDRTTLAQAGVNVIQQLPGFGIVIRNLFTPSTATEFMFSNGVVMRNYIKVSIVDSLQTSENMPNSINRIREDRMAALQFLYRLWNRGSTGNVPLGETFGQSQDAQGNPTNPEDHFEVVSDITNNPQAQINLGQRNIDIYFTYPTPAGSIKVGVGILLRS
jgi:hypothetical protein